MTINRIQDDLKSAQLERQEIKVSTLRLLLSEIHNLEILLRQSSGQEKEISDADLISIISREAKKRREAIEAFRNGGREDQAQKEEAELKILEEYLPVQLSNEELTEIVDQVINKLGVKSMVDMGKVMSEVMGKVAGKADGNTISNLVRQKLS